MHAAQASTAFPVDNGAKQDCMLGTALFKMMFAAMLSDAFMGVMMVFASTAALMGRGTYYLRTLQLKIKDVACPRFHLRADDYALNSGSVQLLEISKERFPNTRENVGFIINITKGK